MIEKHIVNIGYPRSGTSWLWYHADFEPKQDKENQILMTTLDFKRYVDYYSQYKISANFQTNLLVVDTEIIKFVQAHATHISLIVRNPYDFVERYYDWISANSPTDPTDFIVYQGLLNYHDIFQRWKPGSQKFGLFFFEDLELDPDGFYKNYMYFCNEPIPIAKMSNIDYTIKINANPKFKKSKIEFTTAQIKYINNEIDRFQMLINKNLSHWKR